LLPEGDGPRRERFDRRTLADLAGDVYVAEDDRGELVGVVSVAYVRSLARGRFAAVLDAARAGGNPPALLAHPLAFSEERARRRGCRRLTAWPDPADAALHAALVSRGYRRGDALVLELEGAG